MPSPLLSADAVSAGYGDLLAIKDVGLAVEEQSLLGVLGPNGAGKSTLLRALTGVVELRSGSVRWKGTEIGSLRTDLRARQGLAMVQEGRRLFPNLTVQENLTLGGYNRSREERADLQDKALTLFPALKDILDRTAGVLSGGEQQMLTISRALMGAPECLLVDEPSLGLAPFLIDEVYSAFPRLIEDGMTIVLVEQEIGRVTSVADRIMVMHEGRVVHESDARPYRDNPEALAELYFGEVPHEEAVT